MIRTGGSSGAASVAYATANGTASSGTDYTAGSGTLSWAAGDSASKTIVVPISNTTPFTGTRAFTVALLAASGASQGSPASASVTITGSGAVTPGTLRFSAATASVAQSAASVSLTVTRTGGSSGAASVAYATTNGTASSGTDYTAGSGTLSWAAGDSASKTIVVPISNATPFTGTRAFNVALSTASGASLGSPASTSVTITGSGAVTPGTLSFSAATASVAQNAASVSLTVTRTGGSSGAVSVSYTTANGTASSGTDYTAGSGTLSWAAGDSASKTIVVPISNATPFTGTRAFSATLSSPTGGASLGSASSASVTITGSGAVTPGALRFSAATASVAQGATSVPLTVTRTGGSSGAASVMYASVDGTALSGLDFVATVGTLNWAAGDSASKTIVIPLSNLTPFTGTHSFTVVLSLATGSSLGTPAIATVSINGTASSGACAKNSSSWTTTGQFTSKQFGNYIVNNNNWGSTPNQVLWANSEQCWGVTTSATTERNAVTSYPSVTRGWSQNGTIMQQLSTSGTADWTTKSGMGLQVSQLTKANIVWGFEAPTSTGSRWLGLMDIYFHNKSNPAYTEFPPVVDLMLDQAIMDQVLTSGTPNQTSYYAQVAKLRNATTVTLGGQKYLIYVDSPGEAAYHSSGGHTIHLFMLPTTYTDSTGPAWGARGKTTHDLKAIIDYFRQANPKNDAGTALLFASGSPVTAPLITDSLYLNSINAGWEIDVGTVFTNTDFCVSLQNEAECQ